jgi:hypothetical protein
MTAVDYSLMTANPRFYEAQRGAAQMLTATNEGARTSGVTRVTVAVPRWSQKAQHRFGIDGGRWGLLQGPGFVQQLARESEVLRAIGSSDYDRTAGD